MVGANRDGALNAAAVYVADPRRDIQSHFESTLLLERGSKISGVRRWVRRHPGRRLGGSIQVDAATTGARGITLIWLHTQRDVNTYAWIELATSHHYALPQRIQIAGLGDDDTLSVIPFGHRARRVGADFGTATSNDAGERR